MPAAPSEEYCKRQLNALQWKYSDKNVTKKKKKKMQQPHQNQTQTHAIYTWS